MSRWHREIAGAAAAGAGDVAAGGPTKPLPATADAYATSQTLEMAFDTVGVALGAFFDALN
jgi:hypothetical protein